MGIDRYTFNYIEGVKNVRQLMHTTNGTSKKPVEEPFTKEQVKWVETFDKDLSRTHFYPTCDLSQFFQPWLKHDRSKPFCYSQGDFVDGPLGGIIWSIYKINLSLPLSKKGKSLNFTQFTEMTFGYINDRNESAGVGLYVHQKREGSLWMLVVGKNLANKNLEKRSITIFSNGIPVCSEKKWSRNHQTLQDVLDAIESKEISTEFKKFLTIENVNKSRMDAFNKQLIHSSQYLPWPLALLASLIVYDIFLAELTDKIRLSKMEIEKYLADEWMDGLDPNALLGNIKDITESIFPFSDEAKVHSALREFLKQKMITTHFYKEMPYPFKKATFDIQENIKHEEESLLKPEVNLIQTDTRPSTPMLQVEEAKPHKTRMQKMGDGCLLLLTAPILVLAYLAHLIAQCCIYLAEGLAVTPHYNPQFFSPALPAITYAPHPNVPSVFPRQ